MLRVLLAVVILVAVVGGTRAQDGGGDRAQDGGGAHRLHTRSIGLNWNGVIDVIVEDARREIIRQNLDEIALEDVEEEFRRKWSFILIDARFVATGGRLKSFSSIARRGNATVSVAGPVFTLTCDITMREAKIRYERYAVEMWQRTVLSGDIKGNIADNRLRLVLDFEVRDGECLSSLREVKVQEIGGFEVEVSGLGPLDELASQISTWVSKKREGQIVREIEYYLAKEVRKALEDFHCDEYAGVLMVSF